MITLGTSAHVEVFLDDKDVVSWKPVADPVAVETHARTNHAVALVLAEFNCLRNQISDLLSPSQGKEASRLLGLDLFKALLSIWDSDLVIESETTDHLTRSRKHIRQQLLQSARATYVSRVFVTAILLIILLFLLYAKFPFNPAPPLRGYPNIPVFCFGSIGGCLGVVLSVMQRSSALNVDPFSGRIAEGANIRAVLGCLFGGCLAMLIKAKLILGFVEIDATHWDNMKAILVALGAVAGFSERLIPQVLGRLGDNVLTKVGNAN